MYPLLNLRENTVTCPFPDQPMETNDQTQEEGMEEDDKDSEDHETANSNSRKNKRKNFKPRNIVNVEENGDDGEEANDEADEDDEALNLTNSDQANPNPSSPSPMDLSTSLIPRPDMEEDSSDSKSKLSVVRPEILFGDSSPVSSPQPNAPVSPQAPGLAMAGLLPFLNPGGLPSADAMKDAFQEVLKLYGVPNELAEAIAKNAQSAQGRIYYRCIHCFVTAIACHPEKKTIVVDTKIFNIKNILVQNTLFGKEYSKLTLFLENNSLLLLC